MLQYIQTERWNNSIPCATEQRDKYNPFAFTTQLVNLQLPNIKASQVFH